MLTDVRRGIVQIPSGDEEAELYVKVAYTSGYKLGDLVPEAIKQSLLCLVPMLMLSTSAANAEPDKYWRGSSAKAESLAGFSEDMVQEYTRRAGACAKPLDHLATPLQL